LQDGWTLAARFEAGLFCFRRYEKDELLMETQAMQTMLRDSVPMEQPKATMPVQPWQRLRSILCALSFLLIPSLLAVLVLTVCVDDGRISFESLRIVLQAGDAANLCINARSCMSLPDP